MMEASSENRCFAPVALFAYNRVDHLSKTLKALSENKLSEQTDLIIFCDGPKTFADKPDVLAVQNVADNASGFRTVKVYKREKNQGLATSIINGVSEIVEQYGRVIVIEDDIILAPNGLYYFNKMLEQYQDHQEIFSISGFSFPQVKMPIPSHYSYDVYAIPRMQCWGWATWRDRWETADFSVPDYDEFYSSESMKNSYGKLIGFDSLNTLHQCMKNGKDVWACRWVYTHFKNNALCLCPIKSLVDNIGLDGSGQNSGVEIIENDVLSNQTQEWRTPPFGYVDQDLHSSFMSCFGSNRVGIKNKNFSKKFFIEKIKKLTRVFIQ